MFLTALAVTALNSPCFAGSQGQEPAKFSFTNITRQAGFFSLPNAGGHGVQAADVTGDEFVDLYVTNIADDPRENRRELLFINNGDGTFVERALELGVEDDGFYHERSEESHAAVFADFDNDGDFDLFNAHTHTGHSRLYRNEGDGRFVDISESAGIQILDLQSRGVTAGDINGDGLVDVVLSAWDGKRIVGYLNLGFLRFSKHERNGIDGKDLSNQGITLVDYDSDFDLDLVVTGWKLVNLPIGPVGFYQNQGNAIFTDKTQVSRVTSDNGTNGWSFGDLDNDGDPDAVLVSKKRSKVYINKGRGGFEFVQDLFRGGFTAALGDMDHDGDLDIYIGGAEAIYRNNGRGWFELVGDVGLNGIGNNPRAASLADIDNDGDLDIALVSKRGANTLFRNNLNDDNWLQIDLISPGGQVGAFGAKLYVYDAGHLEDPQHLKGFRESRSATGYCAQNSPVIHFGLSAQQSYDLKVLFLDGTVVTHLGIRPPIRLTIDGAQN